MFTDGAARSLARERLVVWCEAAGMVAQLEQIAHPLSIDVRSGGGFDSTDKRHEVAQDIANDGRDAVLLHLGDYDPSGAAAFTACHEDIAAYLEDDAPELEFTARRIALTGTQVETMGIETSPAKKSDKRTAKWKARKRACGGRRRCATPCDP